MKIINNLLFITIIFIMSFSLFNNNLGKGIYDPVERPDSVNLMVEASLFFEAYKNKQYDEWTLTHGWNVINTKPDAFPRNFPYRKMDKIIWSMHDDSSGTEELKQALADTILYLYDLAIVNDPDYAANYYIRKAYVLETWHQADVEWIVAAYESGFQLGQDIVSEIYYKDRLGQIYSNNATEENGYKLKALELYSKLSEQDPENATWISRIESLAENIDELVDITYKAWQLDKENPEKAWKYCTLCLRAQELEKAVEPLEFLIERSPDVVNYWKELARIYDKLDETDKALNSYKTLIDLEPDNRDNYLNIAIIYKKMNQLSVSRSYLQKASKASPGWDFPVYIEGSLYEQAARSCGFEFEDKCVYQLAVDTYRKASNMGGSHSSASAERVQALANSVPTKEDYFFRQYKNGNTIAIEGKCYDWIGRSITVSL